tara:strand:+ start:758 stop:976 length:219 start_codon:yes stop_codon:yes gene_type:complete
MMVKMMKADELKGKSADELKKMLLDLRKEQLNLRFQKNSGQLGNTSQVRKVRRDIARIKTFLNEAAQKNKAA